MPDRFGAIFGVGQSASAGKARRAPSPRTVSSKTLGQQGKSAIDAQRCETTGQRGGLHWLFSHLADRSWRMTTALAAHCCRRSSVPTSGPAAIWEQFRCHQ